MKNKYFWILFALLSAGGIVFSYFYFFKAFPVVSLEVRMDRTMALEKAIELESRYHWVAQGYRSAASFWHDQQVQNYVELEKGGAEAFRKMLLESYYSPYIWTVRHFKEGQTTEVYIYFTPQGQPYGFEQRLPENEQGARLGKSEARLIAENNAQKQWGINFAPYKLIEASQEEKPGKRFDHTFTYQRTDARIGEGQYRLTLVVGGDKLTKLEHWVKVPESFLRHFKEMRSANKTIFMLSLFALLALYFGGGCGLGLAVLLKKRWLIWRTPLKWGVVIGILKVLSDINWLPMDWMNYDTSLSSSVYLFDQIAGYIFDFAAWTALAALSFMVAESMTRRVFPRHIQLWRLWRNDVAASPAVFGRTISGYLFVGIDFGFVIVFYILVSKYLRWWSPSDVLIDPNALAAYFPWLDAFAESLRAGFWEECVFRAIPLAGAGLIAERFGHRRFWLITGLLTQAIIFGAGHAGYANQPAYARLVELILPSIAYGTVYLYFGLLPTIIAHFLYDLIWFSIPIFLSSASNAWIDKSMIIVLGLLPLVILIIKRWRARSWITVTDENYNAGWQPQEKAVVIPKEESGAQAGDAILALFSKRMIVIISICVLCVWGMMTKISQDSLQITISRKDAIMRAKHLLEESKVQLSNDWTVLASLNNRKPALADRFIWQKEGPAMYHKLIGTYIPPPEWEIRFVQFKGDVEQRAEEYVVRIAENGKSIHLRHRLPETRSGAVLNEEEARQIAQSFLSNNYQKESPTLQEMSVSASQKPHRRDWDFSFKDTGVPLKEGEALLNLSIAGDKVVDHERLIHIPEQWEREYTNRYTFHKSIEFFCQLFLIGLMIAQLIGLVIYWSHLHIEKWILIKWFIPLLVMELFINAIQLPRFLAGFSTAEPLRNQILTVVLTLLFKSLVISGVLAIMPIFLQQWKRNQNAGFNSKLILYGITAGFIAAVFLLSVQFIFPVHQPVWASYEIADAYFPVAGEMLSVIEMYMLRTILFMLLMVSFDRWSNGWTRGRFLLASALVFTGLALTGMKYIENISQWLIEGTLAGVLLLAFYYFVFRFNLSLIPVASASMFALMVLKEGLYNAFPGARAGCALGIICIAVFAYYWTAIGGEKRNDGEKGYRGNGEMGIRGNGGEVW